MSGNVLGFTGTRKGLKCAQAVSLDKLLCKLYFDDVHHGGCLGGDLDFHNIVLRNERARLRSRIYIHPAIGFAKQRQLFACDSPYWGKNIVVYPEMEPLTRNRAVVNEIDTLIACPDSKEERVHSETWYTVRRAREYKLMIFIVYPDGSIKCERSI